MDLNVGDDLLDEQGEPESSLVVRTDFSDDAAWLRTQTALMHPEPLGDPEYDGLEPSLTFVENPRFDGFTAEQFVAEVARLGLGVNHLFFADRRAQSEEGHPVVAVDLEQEGPDGDGNTLGRSFRVQADQVGNSVSPNLCLVNMDFHEFADVADASPDGVFRGFPE